MKENLLVILGPTAVGKTELSINIAEKFNGEIISGDSMQVYKGMDIGTAKIKPEQIKEVPHYLIDCFQPDHYFSAAEFQELAARKITEINQRKHLPIIAGGTGLYIKAVTNRYLFPSAPIDESYRQLLNDYVKEYGNEELHNKLKQIDLITANRLHVNDVKRIIRALEIYHSTGKTLSLALEEQTNESPYNLLMIGLTMDRQILYDKINNRVEQMIKQGLVEEVKKLLEFGYDERYNSMQGLGYKEIILYLKGEISLEEAIDQIKQGTRRFAKRQLSWFHNMPDIHWFDMTNDFLEDKQKNIVKIYKLIAGKFSSMKN